MNINEITIVKQNIIGQLSNKLVSPMCVAGSPGTAKSTTIALIAAELGMNLVTCSGPVLSHESLSGLPDTVDASQYQANSIDGSVPQATQWSIPEIMAQALSAAVTKPTVLLIDDFHMVSPHLQAYFYSLLLERRLGNYRLSDNIVVILTMNNSESAGFQGINSAVRNRLSILDVSFNFDHWFTNFGNQLHYFVASFLKAKPHYCQEAETTGIEGYATARAWTSIAAELAHHTPEFIKSNAGLLAGTQVSTDAAKAFHSHVLYIEAVNFTKLVANRTIVDLSTKDPLDSIIYAYITNFITTVDDGLYLFDLINANMQNNASAFVGFTFGELYIKFKHNADMSDGIRFVIDRVIGIPMDHTKYSNTSKQKLEKAFATPVEGLLNMMHKAGEFIL